MNVVKVGGVYVDSESMDEYEAFTRTTAIYPGMNECSFEGLAYVSLGLAGEAGEIANKVKKIARDDEGALTADRREQLFRELGDVFWYLARLADELDFDLSDIALENMNKLAKRQEEGKLQGSGDNR